MWNNHPICEGFVPMLEQCLDVFQAQVLCLDFSAGKLASMSVYGLR